MMTPSRSLSRRRFGMLATSAALATTAVPAAVSTISVFSTAARAAALETTSTPDASQGASPVASAGDIFANLTLEAGVVPTFYGDVEVPESPSRIVAITDGAIDALLALGIQPAGVTASSNGETVAVYLHDKLAADATYVGGWSEIDIEQIVGIGPDLILSDRYLDSLGDGIYDTLSAIAPVIAPAEIEVTDSNVLQQWEYEQLIYGNSVGKLEESKQVILDLRARATGIQPNLGDNAGKSVIVFRPQPEFAVVMAQAWVTGVMLTWSGLRGTAFTDELEPPHSGNTVGIERLNLLDADWLFAAARNEEMVAELETYKENPLFQTVPAYASGQIALVSGDLWSGAIGVLAGHAMLDDIERILIRGELIATPAS